MDHLKDESNRLCQENRQLHGSLLQHQQQINPATSQELSSLAPQVLNSVKKTLARKLGGESTSSLSQDNAMEESKNKNDGKYVSCR